MPSPASATHDTTTPSPDNWPKIRKASVFGLLKKATSGTGVIYSQAQFSVVRALTLEERTLIAAMTEQVKAVSMNVGYDAEDTIPPRVDPDTGEIIEPLR